MTINIMNQYIDLTKKQINTYMKLVFGNKFNKNYNELYIDKYIKIRYYNFHEGDINITIRRKILDNLKELQEDMIIDNIKDRVLIEQMCKFFHYVLYFDNVVHYKSLEKIVERIDKQRKKILNKEQKEFKEKLYEKMLEFNTKKEELLNRFETDDFYLKITNYPDKLNIFRVNLKHNIEFPNVYSEFAIEKAFNMGVISEDKLVIEYYLVVLQVLKDILKQNFKRQYIVEFTDTILTKSKKLKALLNIINNIGIQDKICLKIKHEQFLEKKEKFYDLMKDGYRIAIIIDNSFEVNYKNIETLKMFRFIILNKQLSNYEEIIQYKDNLKNVIEI